MPLQKDALDYIARQREKPMTLHESTFEYLRPTDSQMAEMQAARDLFREFAFRLDGLLPDGPDKTYIMRTLRTVGMWCNVTITRQPDGQPRAVAVPEYPPGHPAPGDLGSAPL